LLAASDNKLIALLDRETIELHFSRRERRERRNHVAAGHSRPTMTVAIRVNEVANLLPTSVIEGGF
jgi:hypothetical protein